MKAKVIGYCPLHYGKDYLRESLESVIDLCDKFVVLYTPSPSYSYGTTATCPESEEELKAIAEDVCGEKLTWHSRNYHSEGDHRNEIFKFSWGFDLLVVVDADEVFNTDELKKGLEIASKGVHRNYGIKGYINLWRSFDYACYDGFLPIRVINLNNQHPDMSSLDVTIWHFSTCQSKTIMDYKYLIHGHKEELRDNWLNDIYYAWDNDNHFDDVHPVAFGLWNPTEYDKQLMPKSLRNHPNFNKEIVE